MKLSDLHREILIACADDDVRIGEVIWLVNGGSYSSVAALSEEVRKQTLKILCDLLSEGLIEAGFPPLTEQMEGIMREDVRQGKLPIEYLSSTLENSERVWKSLSLSSAEIIAYLEKEWNNIDLDQTLVWFRVTESGKWLAQQ